MLCPRTVSRSYSAGVRDLGSLSFGGLVRARVRGWIGVGEWCMLYMVTRAGIREQARVDVWV